MLKTEIAEFMNKEGKMFDLAQKVTYNRNLSAEDKEVYEIADAWVREIGETGNDKDHEIAAFIRKTITEEVYNAPDELLDLLFTRGTVGEFDDYVVTKTPKNTLEAYDAALAGNVDKSYIDFGTLKPTWKHAQVEFELPYIEMRRDGFKSLALLTNYALEALRNKQFYDVFSQVNDAIVGGEQLINEASTLPTQVSWDAFSLYLLDRGASPVAVTLSKYGQVLGRMDGRAAFISDSQRDTFNRYGMQNLVDGVQIATISGAKKLGNGEKLLPDKTIWGFSGEPIGVLDQKGAIRTYETPDNNTEKLNIKITGFEYGFAITDIEKIAKIQMA